MTPRLVRNGTVMRLVTCSASMIERSSSASARSATSAIARSMVSARSTGTNSIWPVRITAGTPRGASRSYGKRLSSSSAHVRLRRIRVGDFDFRLGLSFGEEIDGAPVAELRHGCGGDVAHQLAVVGGGQRRIVETVEVLQPLTMEPFASGDQFGIRDSPFGIELQLLTSSDVTGAADRSGDVAVVVDRHHATAVEPVHGPVRPDGAVFELIRRAFVGRTLDDVQHMTDVIGVHQRQPGVHGAVERLGFEAEQLLQCHVPRRDAGCDVPPPCSELARGKCECEVVVHRRGLMSVCQSVTPRTRRRRANPPYPAGRGRTPVDPKG